MNISEDEDSISPKPIARFHNMLHTIPFLCDGTVYKRVFDTFMQGLVICFVFFYNLHASVLL